MHSRGQELHHLHPQRSCFLRCNSPHRRYQRALDILDISFSRNIAPPLFVMEFLTRVADTIVVYFDKLSETVIKSNIVTVYQVHSLSSQHSQ